jgi:hypothetical protein
VQSVHKIITLARLREQHQISKWIRAMSNIAAEFKAPLVVCELISGQVTRFLWAYRSHQSPARAVDVSER